MGDFIGFKPFSALSTSVLLLVGYWVYKIWLRRAWFSKLSNLPGPKRSHWLFGNTGEILRENPAVAHGAWQAQYGHVYRYPFLFGTDRVFLNDPVAIRHLLLSQPYAFRRSPAVNRHLARSLGDGVLTTNDEIHRRQRRALATAFSRDSVNTYLPLFQQQACKLADKLQASIEAKNSELVDMYEWLENVALDIVALAGFNYNAGGLDGKQSVLARALAQFLSPMSVTPAILAFIYLAEKFSILEKLPLQALRNAKVTSDALKAEARAILKETNLADDDVAGRKDIIALLVKANAKEKHGLSDEEVMAQITTLLAAGMETSAATMSWLLLELSKHTHVQIRLRQEIAAMQSKLLSRQQQACTLEELDQMEYLDAVIREVLRYRSAATMTTRVSFNEQTLPLSEPIRGRNGKSMSSVVIPAGTEIIISIDQWNFDERIFGSDAKMFNPDRWLGPAGAALRESPASKGGPMFPPVMTFLGGVRSCIGARFAILEIKAVIYELMNRFEFSERDAHGTPFRRFVKYHHPHGGRGRARYGRAAPATG